MAINLLRALQIALLTASLAACQSVPVVLEGGLTPTQVAVVKQEGFKLSDDGWLLDLPDRILFQVNQYDIAEDKQAPLIGLAQRLRAVDIQKLRVQGHTDSTGSVEYNETLSKNRAQAVSDVLQKGGFEITRLTVEGYGPNRPIASNDTEEGRASNRRVAVVIVP